MMKTLTKKDKALAQRQTIALTLPKDLLKSVDEAARKESLTRSAFIQKVLMLYLGKYEENK
jgi:metal-responsive CopG/Arc/MetJ family transcriptional regulator